MFKTPSQLLKPISAPASALTPQIISDIEYAISKAPRNAPMHWQWRYRSPMPPGFPELLAAKLRASGWDARCSPVGVVIEIGALTAEGASL